LHPQTSSGRNSRMARSQKDMWDKSPTRIPAAHCKSRKTDLSVPQLQPGPGKALQARTPEQPAKADILDTALWNLLGKHRAAGLSLCLNSPINAALTPLT